jgi:hypothetical protein
MLDFEPKEVLWGVTTPRRDDHLLILYPSHNPPRACTLDLEPREVLWVVTTLRRGDGAQTGGHGVGSFMSTSQEIR